jgi:hypothetical protein
MTNELAGSGICDFSKSNSMVHVTDGTGNGSQIFSESEIRTAHGDTRRRLGASMDAPTLSEGEAAVQGDLGQRRVAATGESDSGKAHSTDEIQSENASVNYVFDENHIFHGNPVFEVGPIFEVEPENEQNGVALPRKKRRLIPESEDVYDYVRKISDDSPLWENIPENLRENLRKELRKIQFHTPSFSSTVTKNGVKYHSEESFEEVKRAAKKNERILRKVLGKVNKNNANLLLKVIEICPRYNDDGNYLLDMLSSISNKNRESFARILANITTRELELLAKNDPLYISELYERKDSFTVDDGGVYLHPDLQTYFEHFRYKGIELKLGGSKKKEVREIEKSMQKMGTTVTFADNYKLAVECKKAFSRVKEVMGKVPGKLLIFSLRSRKFSGFSTSPSKSEREDVAPPPILLETHLVSTTSSDKIAQQRAKAMVKAWGKNGSIPPTIDANTKFDHNFTVAGVVWHECGHSFHRLSLNSASEKYKNFEFPRYTRAAANRTKKELEMSELIQKRVSAYALTNGDECVAEMFSELICGEELPAELVDIYEKLGGPQIGDPARTNRK